MKRRLQRAARRAAENPVLQKSAESLKPTPNLWGLFGILFFFILPELIGFWRGHAIAAWAHSHYLQEPDRILRMNYWLLEKLFEEGGSWVNLGIGVALLGWLIYEWRRGKG
jgi:hypothetical protein